MGSSTHDPEPTGAAVDVVGSATGLAAGAVVDVVGPATGLATGLGVGSQETLQASGQASASTLPLLVVSQ